MLIPLPIDSSLDRIVSSVRQNPLTIVHAPPGSGKTTRVGPALLQRLSDIAKDRIYLLQPRRLAARSVAMRIADENAWELGREVGYHVRFERRFARNTRLIVATEGVLLRRLQEDSTLADTSIVILDEFHERSLDMDVLLGMLREVQTAVRDDLRIVIMSATLDREELSRELSAAPILSVEGRMFPVDIRYRTPRFQQSVVDAVSETITDVLDRHDGDALVFLPGQGEIHRVRDQLLRAGAARDCDVLPLYGSLSLDEQSKIIQPGNRRKVVLATNVAETSLTIEGIRIVVDSGQARVLRFEPSVGLDRLNIEPIAQDSATQRAGRAGRVAEGVCYRLWDEASHRARPSHLEPEVRRIDLAGAILQLFYWGQSDPAKFAWVTQPREDSVAAAIRLLERLGTIQGDRLTDLGRLLARLPLHPRLGRMVVEGKRLGQLHSVALASAMLAERDPFQNHDSKGSDSKFRGKAIHTSQSRRWDSDVATRVELIERFVESGEGETVLGRLHRGSIQPILQAARDIESQIRAVYSVDIDADSGSESDVGHHVVDDFDTRDSRSEMTNATGSEEAIMRSLLCGFPDRLAKRRSSGSNSALMVGGRAVQIAPSSGVHDAELMVCIDVDGRGTEAFVRQASKIDREWLDTALVQHRDDLFFHPSQLQVVARRRILWDDLVLAETPVAIEDRQTAAEILHKAALGAWHAVFPSDDKELVSLIQRTQWLLSVAPDSDLPSMNTEMLHSVCRELCDHHASFSELKKARWYDWIANRFTVPQRQLLDREAPEKLQVPSGSWIRLEYAEGKAPILPVKIQEVFSWKRTPRLAMGRVAVLLHLLAPNMRPQQITDDLESFWATGYTMVKKELKRRYPKHSWPDDPTTAPPTKR